MDSVHEPQIYDIVDLHHLHHLHQVSYLPRFAGDAEGVPGELAP